jgi:hypothetical protein
MPWLARYVADTLENTAGNAEIVGVSHITEEGT